MIAKSRHLSFEEAARQARSKPGVWVVMRVDPSATVVTRIRSGAIAELSPLHFEAKSASYTVDERRVYEILVRYVGDTQEQENFTPVEYAQALASEAVQIALLNELRALRRQR